MTQFDIDTITDRGERVTHLRPDNCYYAHLSIYHFALDYCRGKRVLDAGSGAGSGAAYLADGGAREVVGIDLSVAAVEFSRAQFVRPNLHYDQMSLERIEGLPAGAFEVIVSSNTLEHLPDVVSFLHTAHKLLAPDGVMIVAVPPITNAYERSLNIENPFHLNIWSPRQWLHTLGLFFAEAAGYTHGFREAGVVLDFGRMPEQVEISQHDFVFTAYPAERLAELPSITAIFAARTPRPVAELPQPGAPLTFVDDSFTSAPSDKALQLRMRRELEGLWERLHTAEGNLHMLQAQHHELNVRLQAVTNAAVMNDAYVRRLEQTLTEKEHHINTLETLIRRLEHGRVLRLLRLLRR